MGTANTDVTDSSHQPNQPVNMMEILFFFVGVALLANAPERIPEKKKRSREKDLSAVEFRAAPPVSTGGKMSSRAARQRVMAHREEQLAAQKVAPLFSW